jgi:3-phosphoshikimate 1-carboxyvinyltransferase
VTDLNIQGGRTGLHLEVDVPSDKSISHRSIIFSSLAEGTTVIHNFLLAEDTLNTLDIFRKLGVTISNQQNTVTVIGLGMRGLKNSEEPLDVGNSGTAIRLILGVLSGQSFSSEISGDESIVKRPMKRVTDPLTVMGGTFYSQENGCWVAVKKGEPCTPPLRVDGIANLSGIDYKMPISSAQVKSAILLAGLYSEESIEIHDPGKSRDHTEVMLAQFGLSVEIDNGRVMMNRGPKILKSPGEINVPVDISSAAFWLVAALILPNCSVTIKNVGLNKTRDGVLTVLKQMGANLVIDLDPLISGGELTGTVTAKSSSLQGVVFPVDSIATYIDEIPILAVAASFAEGETILSGAAELRVKESDRIKTTCAMLQSFGVQVSEHEEGFCIKGKGTIQPAQCESFSDHRIAMSAAIFSLMLDDSSRVLNTKCIETSYPGFIDTLRLFSKEVTVCD